MKRIILFLLIIGSYAYADINFVDMNLSASNKLLFSMAMQMPGYGEYETLFITDLVTKDMKQLTFFPESILLLKGMGQIQLQNRFGVFRIEPDLKTITTLELFSSFVKNNVVQRGKLYPIQSSPDGKYMLYIKNASGGFGSLILYNIEKEKEITISKKAELDFNNPPALWSLDSRFFIYSNKNTIYYYSLDQMEEKRVFAENLRKIGRGKLENVVWRDRETLFYITGSLVYSIKNREFFTLPFYKEILHIGTVIGKIPYEFDPNFDRFWLSPDGNKILLCKGGRNIFLYYLRSDDYTSVGDVKSLPYLYLPNNTQVKKVTWSARDKITILTRQIEKGKIKSTLFWLNIPEKALVSYFEQSSDGDVSDIILSPDEKTIALLKTNSIELREYDSWKISESISHPEPQRFIWKSEKELVIAGPWYTEVYDTLLRKSTLIALSQANVYGFSEDEKSILTRIKDRVYSIGLNETMWKTIADYKVTQPSIVSESFRVYFSSSTEFIFKNMIMVRNIKKDTFGTVPLIDEGTGIVYEPFPEKEEPVNFYHFNHGSRLRRREVALVFDVINSIQGLTTILHILSEYNITCTFFINGEAIRRFPGAVREIIGAEHEVGSLFYAYFNMTDSKYKLDRDFIKTGLAINEDEYFAATGRDFSLFWHAPYYFINSDIIAVSKEMGYTYVGKDIDTMDWVTESEMNITRGIYKTASELIEKIITEKKPGSIIPIQVGIPGGKREDYLFQKLDVLINNLLNRGYDIVPVSTLIKHAK